MIVTATRAPGATSWRATVAVAGGVTHRVVIDDRFPLTVAQVAAVAQGPIAAGDHWCRACSNRLQHIYRTVGELLTLECSKCGNLA